MQEADFYSLLKDGHIACHLCAHNCRIAEGKTGICKVRVHQDHKLYSLDYGHLIAEHADPIEKKPLYHFLPGSQAYSIASPGCNFRCAWCQNWDISQTSFATGVHDSRMRTRLFSKRRVRISKNQQLKLKARRSSFSDRGDRVLPMTGPKRFRIPPSSLSI